MAVDYRYLDLTWEENYKGNRNDLITPVQK